MEEAVKEPVPMYGNLYTYADYLRWEFEERLEIIRGKIYWMTPGPGRTHQTIVTRLSFHLGNYFENHRCHLFHAPFDVRLIDPMKKSKEDEDIVTVCQPDLMVVCDEKKLEERGVIGAPDFIVEILSPGNAKKEMGIKFELYEENGVREYWMVGPSEHVIYQYVFNGEKFIGRKPVIEDEKIHSAIFPNLAFDVEQIFSKRNQ